MKADDVFKALEEMDFSEFLEPLKSSLEGKCFVRMKILLSLSVVTFMEC